MRTSNSELQACTHTPDLEPSIRPRRVAAHRRVVIVRPVGGGGFRIWNGDWETYQMARMGVGGRRGGGGVYLDDITAHLVCVGFKG